VVIAASAVIVVLLVTLLSGVGRNP
jgi:hypothetical protein